MDRLEYVISTLTSLTANAHRDPKRSGKPFSPADFIPKWGGAEEPEPDREGMAPERVLGVMDGFVRRQEIAGS